MADIEIVVLGAGVVGLTTALQLLRAGYLRVTVVAKHMPSDRDPMYASPWAGAIFVPESRENTREQRWELASWKELFALAETEPAAGIWLQDKFSFYCEADYPKEKAYDWWQNTVLDYHYLSQAAVPDFADWGIKYRTLALDPDTYLHYLQTRCVSLGARFIQQEVKHIGDALASNLNMSAQGDSDRVSIVVNCTGLNARYLGGVEDEAVFPIRGQLVVVKNKSGGMYFTPHNETLRMNKALDEVSYIIERPAGAGTALGGTHTALESVDPIELSRGPDMDIAQRIMERAIRICPKLVPENTGIEALEVIRHQVGFRPCRKGGPRIELEEMQEPKYGLLKVVHNYGVGGLGYQLSYGVANEVVGIVKSLGASL